MCRNAISEIIELVNYTFFLMKTHFKKVYEYIRSFTWFLTNCPIVHQTTHKERVKLLNIITVKFKEVRTKMMQKYEKDESFFLA